MSKNPEIAKKKILVAPLHWGLGHATRCIPIINALVANGFEPVIASDGGALELLKKEFPNLKAYELPSYNITYAKKGKNFKIKLLKNAPFLLRTIKKEKKFVEKLVKKERLDGIISDNRFGVRHNAIPSVFITHQLKVLSGNTTWLSSKLHQNIIKKFTECWVPDFEGSPNLSGILGHPKTHFENLKYIGPLSRFEKKALRSTIDVLVILSGPEPQRSQLEKKLLLELERYKGKVVFVRGIIKDHQIITELKHISCYNYMTSSQLEEAINSCDFVVSRSGYTTVMDLAKLGKKAVFIPTPGQFEQEYLADKLNEDKIIPAVNQDAFNIRDLVLPEDFSGFSSFQNTLDFEELFSLF